jgi:putative IMPACT (imprinted ancient) family translation regulator
VATHTVEVTVPYSAFEPVRLLISEHHGEVLQQEFAAQVSLAARFPVRDFAEFQAALQELSNGVLSATVVETNEASIMPVSEDG